MKMVEVKTADLIGKQLDYAVAVVEGHPLCEECMYGSDVLIIGTGYGDLEGFSPSTRWIQCGPLIDKYDVWFNSRDHHERIAAWANTNTPSVKILGCGKSRLTAACRAIVQAKLGPMVSVPEEVE
jgi:hypothetical protein